MRYKGLFLDFILGLLLPLIIGLIVLHRMFTSAGFILYWDVARDLDPKYFIQTRLLHSWDMYDSSPNPITSFLLLALNTIYDFLGFPADFAWKLTLLQNYVLAGVSMYIATRILLPKWEHKTAYYGACCAASLTYMLTTPLISQITVTPRVVSYFAIPLAIAFYVKLLRDENGVIRNSVLVAFSLVLLSAWNPLLLEGIAVLILYQLYRLVTSGNKMLQTLRRDILRNTTLMTVFSAFYATSFFNSIVMEAFTKHFLHVDEVTFPIIPPLPPENPWIDPQWTVLNVLTLKIMWVVEPVALTTFANFAIPLIAFSTLLIYARRKNETAHIVVFHALLSLIVIVIASQNSPFGSIILSIVKLTKASGLWYRFLMEASGYAFLLSYIYSFLAGIFAGYMLNKLDQKIIHLKVNQKIIHLCETHRVVGFRSLNRFIQLTAVAWIIIIIVATIAPWVLYSYPIITNINDKVLNPVVIPGEYYSVDAWLKNDTTYYRVWWLPRPLFTMFDYNWAPSPFIGGWIETISPKPTLWDSDLTTYNYLLELIEGKSNNTGEILSIAGVKYVVIHTDLNDHSLGLGKQQALEALLSNLQKQEDLRLAYHDDFIYVFENENYSSYIQTPSKIALIVGGFNTLSSLTEYKGFDIRNYAVVFTEQISSSSLTKLLSLADVVFFASTMGLEDLYLQLDQGDFIYPAQYLSSKYSMGFEAGGGDIITLFMTSQTSGKYFNQEGDFLYGSSSISSSSTGAMINVPVNIVAKDNYEAWIRILRSPLGGKLSIYVDGNFAGLVDTSAPYAYFKWIKINDMALSPGTHEITIKNEFGYNVINTLLVASKTRLDSLRNLVMNELSNKEVILVNRSFIALAKHVDQSATDPNLSENYVYGRNMLAQCFEPKVSSISGVGLYKSKIGDPGNLVVELHPTNGAGIISSKVLARVTIPPTATATQFGRFDYVNLAYNRLEPGNEYCIVVYQEGFQGDPKNYYDLWGIPDIYPNGFLLHSNNGGLSWVKDDSHDLFFQTYFIQEEETYDLEKAAYSRISLYSWDIKKDMLYEIKELPPSDSAKILNFTMPFPGKYVVTVNASKPFTLIIPERYDPLWHIANINNSLHFPAYSFLNGYYINKTGTFQVIIEYAMNTPFEIGKWISILSMIVLPVLAITFEKRPMVRGWSKRFYRKFITTTNHHFRIFKLNCIKLPSNGT